MSPAWLPPRSIPSANLITEESALDATVTFSSDTRRYSLNSQLVTASGAWIPSSSRCLQSPTHRLVVIIILIVMMMLMTLFSLNLKHKRATVTVSGIEPSSFFRKHFSRHIKQCSYYLDKNHQGLNLGSNASENHLYFEIGRVLIY